MPLFGKKKNPTICPYCKSKNIKVDKNMEKVAGSYIWICSDCGRRWY